MDKKFCKAILKTLALFAWGIFTTWVISKYSTPRDYEWYSISVLVCVITTLSIDYYKNKKD